MACRPTYAIPRNSSTGGCLLTVCVDDYLCAGPGYSAELIGVMETPKVASKVNLDFSALLGPLFFTWVIQMLLPIL